jgi:hypothetical protein
VSVCPGRRTVLKGVLVLAALPVAGFTADEVRADFRVVPYVSRPAADVRMGASFVVPDRATALHAV